MPSTRTIGRRWTALDIALIRLRAGSMESGRGLSMSSFIADGEHHDSVFVF
jgi:hypothetical protein